MGMFSWVATTGRKSQAAAHIQQYFEMIQQHGEFDANPATTANGLVTLACNRMPSLTDNQKGFVLAASVLAIVVMEAEIPLATRDTFAMALAGMLKAAHGERHLHSYEDQKALEVAQRIYGTFRELVPSAPYIPRPPEAAPSMPESAQQPQEHSAQERARAMDDLIKQMSSR